MFEPTAELIEVHAIAPDKIVLEVETLIPTARLRRLNRFSAKHGGQLAFEVIYEGLHRRRNGPSLVLGRSFEEADAPKPARRDRRPGRPAATEVHRRAIGSASGMVDGLRIRPGRMGHGERIASVA